MTYTDFIHVLGDGILWTTEIIFEHVANYFNDALIILGIIGMIYWERQLSKYKKRAAEDPTILE